jgi:hypothetical protein
MVLDNDSIGGRTAAMMGYYKVADFVFAVKLRCERDLDVLLSSFSSFRIDDPGTEEQLFELIEKEEAGECPRSEFIEEDNNDLGQTKLYHTEDGYRITLKYLECVHVMDADPEFKRVSVTLRWEDVYVSTALSSMLRIAFAQAILMHSAVSLHSSVVVYEGKGNLFMGRSGTGKSTHSRLWIEHLGARLLNDDNPIVRVVQGRAIVYGSPWSGKTRCYKNESVSVGAIVRLVQAPENRFEQKTDVEAFSLLLPGCSVLKYDRKLYGALCETLIELTEIVCVGEMRCLPDKEAALVCCENINTVSRINNEE